MKLPGPDHPITIKANPKRLQVLFRGHLIADTRGALELKEASYPAVQYIPLGDVEAAVLTPTDHHTHCPYKGDASYFTISRDGEIAENAVWTYPEPYPAMAEIAGLVAFYPNQVEIVEVAGSDETDAIRDAIEHTDSGSGASQLEHWPAGDPRERH